MLEQFSEGIVSIVSDSYDVYEAFEKLYGEEERNYVILLFERRRMAVDWSFDPILAILLQLYTRFYKFWKRNLARRQTNVDTSCYRHTSGYCRAMVSAMKPSKTY
jgi:hypothetical protein